LRRYAEALAPGFVGLYQANAQSTRSLTGRGEAGGVETEKKPGEIIEEPSHQEDRNGFA